MDKELHARQQTMYHKIFKPCHHTLSRFKDKILQQVHVSSDANFLVLILLIHLQGPFPGQL